MTSTGPGTPDPGSPTPEEHGDADRRPAAEEVDRLHAELAALGEELPKLVDDVRDAASED